MVYPPLPLEEYHEAFFRDNGAIQGLGSKRNSQPNLS